MRPAVVVSHFHADVPFLDTRVRARELRDELEIMLANATEVAACDTPASFATSRNVMPKAPSRASTLSAASSSDSRKFPW